MRYFNCEFHGSLSHHISTERADNLLIQNSLFENSKNTSICLNSYSQAEVSKCTFKNSQKDGIVAYNYSKAFPSETKFESMKTAIRLINLAEADIQKCEFIDLSEYGVKCVDKSKAIVDACLLSNCSICSFDILTVSIVNVTNTVIYQPNNIPPCRVRYGGILILKNVKIKSNADRIFELIDFQQVSSIGIEFNDTHFPSTFEWSKEKTKQNNDEMSQLSKTC